MDFKLTQENGLLQLQLFQQFIAPACSKTSESFLSALALASRKIGQKQSLCNSGKLENEYLV